MRDMCATQLQLSTRDADYLDLQWCHSRTGRFEEMAEKVDYHEVIVDLKARRTALDKLIASVRALMLDRGQRGPTKLDVRGSGPSRPRMAIDPNAFFGMTQLDAAKKFLRMARRPQHTLEIADALGRGGLKRPGRNVMNTILGRATRDREIIRAGKAVWALAEWQPKASRMAARRRPRNKHSR
jgi:hypothetical protein